MTNNKRIHELLELLKDSNKNKSYINEMGQCVFVPPAEIPINEILQHLLGWILLQTTVNFVADVEETMNGSLTSYSNICDMSEQNLQLCKQKSQEENVKKIAGD